MASAIGVLPSGRQGAPLAPVRTVEDVGAGRIGVDGPASGDCPHLFGEEWIVGDVWLRLLRELVRVVELVQAGEPDDLRQRLLPRPADLRVALRPPRDATGGDQRARRPRPRLCVRRDVRGRAMAGCCPDDASRA